MISETAICEGKTNLDLAPVVQRMDNAIHRINHFLLDSVVCFDNMYPLDSDLSSGLVCFFRLVVGVVYIKAILA